MGKLDNNKKLKRDSLLNTAFNLFTTKGITKTSISDIVGDAGVAKGTFYLYFKDKHDIRNKLISHKSSQLFQNAIVSLEKTDKNVISFTDKIIYIVDDIVNQLDKNKILMNFISKNLSWGILKNALTSPMNDDIDFRIVYDKLIDEAPVRFDQPEVMLYMIVELVSSTCYSSILYDEPVCLEKLKPSLYAAIKSIISNSIVEEK